MKRLAQSIVAVAFGALIVTASAIGGVMLTNPTVQTVDDASDQFVQRGEGQVVIAAGTAIAIAALGKEVYDHHKDSIDTENLQQADALETKKEIYDQASIQNQNNNLIDTSLGNYLNDTQTIALMKGKNAYIRALENGSSESVARNDATEAVADYYATKHLNLIASWNTSVTVTNSTYQTAENTTGLNTTDSSGLGYVHVEYRDGDSDHNQDNYWMMETFPTKQVQLANSSTAPALAINATKIDGGSNAGTENFTVDRGIVPINEFGHQNAHGIAVKPPTTDYDHLQFVDFQRYADRWSQVNSQNDAVQAELDTFINNTYSSYQQGDINASDLVDPYLGSAEYSPENQSQFQDWSLRMISSLGVDTPENLSNIGRMTIVSGANSYDGILMSDGQPTDGFTVGNTYNTSNLQGLQFVALADGGVKELSGNFTLESAETSDGNVIAENESITYRNVTYQTANTTEFQELQSQLDGLTAQINARQQELRNAGGGGLLPDFGLGGVGAPAGLIVLGAVVFLLGRN